MAVLAFLYLASSHIQDKLVSYVSIEPKSKGQFGANWLGPTGWGQQAGEPAGPTGWANRLGQLAGPTGWGQLAGAAGLNSNIYC